jgi:hypothetical protein
MQLLNAHDLTVSAMADTVLPADVGERVIRPLTKLIAQGRTQEAAEVWRRAVKLAEGQTPTNQHVRRALAEHNKMMGYTPAKQTEMRSQTLRETYRSRVKRDFEWLVGHCSPDEMKALLVELAERVAAEKQWARGEA